MVQSFDGTETIIIDDFKKSFKEDKKNIILLASTIFGVETLDNLINWFEKRYTLTKDETHDEGYKCDNYKIYEFSNIIIISFRNLSEDESQYLNLKQLLDNKLVNDELTQNSKFIKKVLIQLIFFLTQNNYDLLNYILNQNSSKKKFYIVGYGQSGIFAVYLHIILKLILKFDYVKTYIYSGYKIIPSHLIKSLNDIYYLILEKDINSCKNLNHLKSFIFPNNLYFIKDYNIKLLTPRDLNTYCEKPTPGFLGSIYDKLWNKHTINTINQYSIILKKIITYKFLFTKCLKDTEGKTLDDLKNTLIDKLNVIRSTSYRYYKMSEVNKAEITTWGHFNKCVKENLSEFSTMLDFFFINFNYQKNELPIYLKLFTQANFANMRSFYKYIGVKNFKKFNDNINIINQNVISQFIKFFYPNLDSTNVYSETLIDCTNDFIIGSIINKILGIKDDENIVYKNYQDEIRQESLELFEVLINSGAIPRILTEAQKLKDANSYYRTIAWGVGILLFVIYLLTTFFVSMTQPAIGFFMVLIPLGLMVCYGISMDIDINATNFNPIDCFIGFMYGVCYAVSLFALG